MGVGKSIPGPDGKHRYLISVRQESAGWGKYRVGQELWRWWTAENTITAGGEVILGFDGIWRAHFGFPRVDGEGKTKYQAIRAAYETKYPEPRKATA